MILKQANLKYYMYNKNSTFHKKINNFKNIF